MPMPDPIEAAVAALDPAAQAVVRMVWHLHEELEVELRTLRDEVARRDQEAAKRDAETAALKAQVETYKKMLFGRRTEKLPPISSEVRKAVEAEDFPLELASTATADELKTAQTTARRKRGRKDSEEKRERTKKSLAKLPIVREEVLVRQDQLPDGMSRDAFGVLGIEVVRRIEHVREHLVMVEYHLEKLAERNGDLIIQGEAPLNVVDGGAWGPSVYAHTAVAKCVDSMPFYRQERTLARAGHGIARSVLCGLFHALANAVEPIYKRMLEVVREAHYLHADETTLKVAEPGNPRKAWIWVFLSELVVAFVFSETRAGETANHLLVGTTGTLVVDGYGGYNGVVGDDRRVRVGCWAYARRKFFEALSASPEARELLDLITQLYRVEHDAAELEILGTPAHKDLRAKRSRPLVEQIQSWVAAHRLTTNPGGPLGKALTYAHNQSAALSAFLDDPKLPLDNNLAERALRIIAVGRKNFLFAGHADGGHNLAVLQSLCSTCLLHGVNPYEYLKDVAVRVRTHPASRIDELLPWNWKPLDHLEAA